MKKNLFIITVFLLALTVSVSAFTAGAKGIALNPYDKENQRYEAEIISHVLGKQYDGEYFYYELFDYYSTEDESATPEYVLLFVASNVITPAENEGYRLGDYVIFTNASYTPYSLGFYIYLPNKGEVYTLKEAWDNNIDGLVAIFTQCQLLNDYVRLAGDVNVDNKLNIRDATLIQKSIAGLEIIELDRYGVENPTNYFSDYNSDGERNVKDATAIQKHIAGLE